MSTGAESELTAFHEFVATNLAEEAGSLSLDEDVEAFREYQAQLSRLQIELAASKQELAQTGGAPLDMERVLAHVSDILRSEGITD